jgi:membrane-associated phospholipid phosphatase
MRFKLLLLVFCMPVMSSFINSEYISRGLSPACPEVYAQGFKNDVKDFFIVGGDVYTAPAHFDKEDWIKLGATAAATTGAYFLDKEVKRLFARNHSSTADFIFGIDGDLVMGTAAGSMFALYGYGALADNDKIKNLGLRLGEATFYAATVNILAKMIIGRKRPKADCGCSSFDMFTTDINNSSLPSTHTTLSFAFAAVMADYNDNTIWKVTWYTLAGLVGMARIYHNMHWFSDTVLGAALGYYIGEFVVNHPANNDDKPAPVSVMPVGNLVNFKIMF